jgi:hypothetical protein
MHSGNELLIYKFEKIYLAYFFVKKTENICFKTYNLNSKFDRKLYFNIHIISSFKITLYSIKNKRSKMTIKNQFFNHTIIKKILTVY